MWNLFNCYLSGRHEFGVWCEPGTVFLRCVHCGKRSSGWAIEKNPPRHTAPMPAKAHRLPPVTTPRLLPFNRAAAR